MEQLPVFNEHSLIILSREGGVAFIPKLSAPQRFALCDLDHAQRERLERLVTRMAPLAKPRNDPRPAGSGDQRYFRIQVYWQMSGQQQSPQLELLIPESSAPPELQRLWKNGRMDSEP